MWWLTYRKFTQIQVVIVRARSLLQARMEVSVAGLDDGTTYQEGHEIDAPHAKRVPKDAVGCPSSNGSAAQHAYRRRDPKPIYTKGSWRRPFAPWIRDRQSGEHQEYDEAPTDPSLLARIRVMARGQQLLVSVDSNFPTAAHATIDASMWGFDSGPVIGIEDFAIARFYTVLFARGRLRGWRAWFNTLMRRKSDYEIRAQARTAMEAA